MIKSKRMKSAGHVNRMGQIRNAYIKVENPEGERPFGRPKCMWEGNRISLEETGWESAEWNQIIRLWIGTNVLLLRTR
jgi:hypothetical protein